MEPKRRLPLLGSSSAPGGHGAGGDDGQGDDEERPPWQWVGFGTAAIFGAWLPLAYIGEALKVRAIRGYVGETRTFEEAQAALAGLSDGDRTKLAVLTVLLHAVPLLAGAYAGGFLVGKWGGKAGVREAALAGVSTALIVSALSCASTGISWAPLIGFALATPMAALGGYVGRGKRPRTPAARM